MSANPSSFMVAGVGFEPTRDPAPPGAGTPPKGPGRAYTRHPMALCVSLVLETTRAPQGPPARHGNQSCSFRRGKIAARATVHKSALPSDRSTSWASSEQWSWLLPLGKTAAIPASLRVLASACADRLHHAYPSDPEAAGARDFRLARGRGESRRRAANRRRSAGRARAVGRRQAARPERRVRLHQRRSGVRAGPRRVHSFHRQDVAGLAHQAGAFRPAHYQRLAGAVLGAVQESRERGRPGRPHDHER